MYPVITYHITSYLNLPSNVPINNNFFAEIISNSNNIIDCGLVEADYLLGCDVSLDRIVEL